MVTPLPRLGTFLIVLGLSGILYYLPEALYIIREPSVKFIPVYLMVLAVDMILAGMTIGAGVGVRRGSDWAPALALWTAGVVFVTSAAFCVLVIPEVLRGLRLYLVGQDWNSMPRVLFHTAAVAFWPYAVQVLTKNAPAESRERLWRVLGASIVAGALLAVGLYQALVWWT